MKDLFLITTYAPDNVRKDILRNFVKSIDKEKYDIMVVSHSSIPTDVIEDVNYFIYDAQNILLTDTEYKYTMFYNSSNFQVISTENRPFNHFLAALKLVTLGLSTARNEGYTKVHCIEYDTELKSDSEFVENSRLLEENSLVYYETDYVPTIISFPISFNLNKIDERWFQFDVEALKKWIANDAFKTIENYESVLLKDENSHIKFYTALAENGVKINTFYSGGEDVWVTPVVDSNNRLLLFAWNRSNTLQVENIALYNVKAIVNNETYYNWDLPLNTWNLNSLGNFNDINNLTIIRNGKRIVDYDFTQINKDTYKMSNYLTNNG